MILRIIDKETGLFLRDDFTAGPGESALDAAPAQGLYRPRWDGERWVEGMPQAEIDALNSQTPEPSIEERVALMEEAVSLIAEVVL